VFTISNLTVSEYLVDGELPTLEVCFSGWVVAAGMAAKKELIACEECLPGWECGKDISVVIPDKYLEVYIEEASATGLINVDVILESANISRGGWFAESEVYGPSPYEGTRADLADANFAWDPEYSYRLELK
jgi:hypothetical protein